MERGWKPNVEICPPCPRCGSSSTKFCYYNNYSLTQPRYFCKGCRRYWTKGGSLRNIPVGGGCRKTRRAKSIRICDSVNPQNFLADGRGESTGYGGRGNVENHSCGLGGGSSTAQPTNIDLQQVYANFLNQRPQNIVHHEQTHDQVLGSDVDPMSLFGFHNIPNMEMELGGTNYGSNLESFLNEGNALQFCGYNSIFSNNEEDQERNYFGASGDIISNCGLPPLPGEEMRWSESNNGFSGHVLTSTIEPEGQVSGECTVKMFDLPSNSDTIFRP